MGKESNYNYGIHPDKVDFVLLSGLIHVELKAYFWFMILPIDGPLMVSIDG